jgi:hypothetical protein
VKGRGLGLGELGSAAWDEAGSLKASGNEKPSFTVISAKAPQ